MHVDEFNKQLAPYYAQFGYYASGSLPDPAQNTVIENLTSNPDIAVAITLENIAILNDL